MFKTKRFLKAAVLVCSLGIGGTAIADQSFPTVTMKHSAGGTIEGKVSQITGKFEYVAGTHKGAKNKWIKSTLVPVGKKVLIGGVAFAATGTAPAWGSIVGTGLTIYSAYSLGRDVYVSVRDN